MKKKKLNNFIVLSIAFHVLLITAVLLYFFKYPLSQAKPGTVLVGLISIDTNANEETSSTERTENNKQEVNKPKLALEKKPLQEKIINKKKTIQQPAVKNTAKETKPETKTVALNYNAAKIENESPSAGYDKKAPAETVVSHAPKNTIAYPNYRLNPKPNYPRVARKRGYEGEVKLKVLVLSNGKVGKIEVVRPSGFKILDDEAVDAVKNWIFIPGKQNGKEISSWVTVPITFQLKNS